MTLDMVPCAPTSAFLSKSAANSSHISRIAQAYETQKCWKYEQTRPKAMQRAHFIGFGLGSARQTCLMSYSADPTNTGIFSHKHCPQRIQLPASENQNPELPHKPFQDVKTLSPCMGPHCKHLVCSGLPQTLSNRHAAVASKRAAGYTKLLARLAW